MGYDETRTRAFYRDLKQRVLGLPGVQSVSLSFAVPLAFQGKSAPIVIEGRPTATDKQAPVVTYSSIDPAYFETMRVPLISGRAFRASDDETGRPVAIINQTMARKFWPGENPLGKRLSLRGPTGPFVEVVGTAKDGQYLFLTPEAQAYFFVPIAQSYSSQRSLQVRSSVPPESLMNLVQEEIRSLAPDLPVMDIRPMQQIVLGITGLFIFRLAATLAAMLGMLGLTLAAVGVYGVVSFAASRRTHEIGIRVALGARRGDILRLVSRQGLVLVAAGIIVGLVAALALTRVMSRLLIGVTATDPVTYASVAVLLASVALAACWIPARRAVRVDPVVALRYE